MGYRKLFLSRWAALLWAAGIVWTAVDTVGFGPPAHAPATVTGNTTSAPDDTDATGAMVNAADLAILANAMSAN